MIKWKNSTQRKPLSDKDLMFGLLLIAGVIECLFIGLESLLSYLGYYLAEDYIIVPCLLFAGMALTQKLTPFAKSRLRLSALMVVWFVVVQIQHKLAGMGTHPIGTVLFVYLMAFPFASVTEDSASAGIRIIGKCFLAASMVLLLYTAILLLDCVPSVLDPFVYWDGARLHVFWHSNITACIFMIGIGIAIAFWFQAKTWKGKVFYAVLAAVQFGAMALTNCRTTLLMTSAFLGGIVFFAGRKNNWKQFAAVVIAALVVAAGSFWGMGEIFDLHNEGLKNKISQQLEAVIEQNEQLTEEDIDRIKENTTENFSIYEGQVHIFSNSGQGTLSGDMRTLNGRTGIWKSALAAIRDNRSLALWGTEYVDVTISAYNSFEVLHAHNSWMEALMRLGIPGLLMALVFTAIAVRSAWVLVWSRSVEIWKKVMAMLTMCVMVAGFLEPYLFITNVYYHFIDFIFFFCTGYLDYWRKQLLDEKV